MSEMQPRSNGVKLTTALNIAVILGVGVIGYWTRSIEKRLDKGAERMDGIEDELKDLKTELIHGLKNVISEVRDQKLSELKNELKDRKSSDSNLKNDIIKIVIVAVISAIGYLFIKSYG